MTAGPAGADAAFPYGTRLTQLAEERGEATAVTLVAEDGGERTVGWRELDRRSNQLARVFASHGLGVGEPVAICLKNSVEHLLAGFAGWKVGAVVVPIRWDLPDWERDRLMAVLRPALIVDAGTGASLRGECARVVGPSARRRVAARVGRVQLGVDGDAQGHRAEGPGPLRRRHGCHLGGGGLVRADGTGSAGAVPGADLPHQRVHGLPRPAAR